MNVLSYNVRGLGRGVKWAAIRRLVNKFHVDVLCIQETKKDQIDDRLCKALWGASDVSWDFQPAVNTAGYYVCGMINLSELIAGQGVEATSC